MKQPLTGHRFDRLLVQERAPSKWPSVMYYWCLCDCGQRTVVRAQRLRTGETRSCGCLMREMYGQHGVTHGLSRTFVGSSWQMMMSRCFNANFTKYEDYGGRGIIPCEFIKASPANLLLLLGDRPDRRHSLDRIDNLKGYTCGTCAECFEKGFALNVRWATAQTQRINQRRMRMIVINGESKTATEWAGILGIDRHTVSKRYGKTTA
jgi:hypothetical protein